MVLNRLGERFEHEGTVYIIGEIVVGTSESEYEGLFGTIMEIRDGEDKETENDTPDIYCYFEPPVLPYDIQKLERSFSSSYRQPKKIEDIILDFVIMAPKMLAPLCSSQKNSEQLEVYIVHKNWVVEGEDGYSMTPFLDYSSARYKFNEELKKEQNTGCIYSWDKNDGLVVESRKDYYEAYLDDEYSWNHFKITIEKKNACLPNAVLANVGCAYTKQRRMEEFASYTAEWDDAEALSEERYRQFISDPSIPERIENRLNKCNRYWECYWDSIAGVEKELLDVYLEPNTSPDCFSPEPDNPYPLCVGNGKKECRKCCLYVNMEDEGGY